MSTNKESEQKPWPRPYLFASTAYRNFTFSFIYAKQGAQYGGIMVIPIYIGTHTKVSFFSKFRIRYTKTSPIKHL